MNSAFDRDVWAVFGMPLDNVSLDEAARLIEQAVKTRTRLSFVTPNVNWMVRALKDEEAMRQIVNADLSLADGAPVVWLARQLGMPLEERVAGSDLFDRLRNDKAADALPIRVFFFGGREGAAEAAFNALNEEQGRMIAAGWHNPGFGDVESMSSAQIRDKINAANPDFIIVSLGAAKGQDWIEYNQSNLEAPVIAHLGAVVDFVAGSIQRAPRWVSRLGVEWVWRIFAEPSLWRRYWNDGKDLIGIVKGNLGRLKKAARPKQTRQPVEAAFNGSALTMSGDLVLETREEIRDNLSRVAQKPGDCQLDLTAVRTIDASALGQLRMLEQCLMRRGNRLEILPSPEIEPALQVARMTL
jgi:N-acetylglucosaminyldiphosphoundecaprenol N-acetyl-beta-D-mannosaminyltransferase